MDIDEEKDGFWMILDSFLIFNGDGREPLIISLLETTWSPWNFAGLMLEIPAFLDAKYGNEQMVVLYILEKFVGREKEKIESSTYILPAILTVDILT